VPLPLALARVRSSRDTIESAMPEAPRCPICQARKPKRWCPARNESICAVCCGREREQSIRCPYECEFLRESRKHEELMELDPKAVPYPELEITHRFLEENGLLGQFLGESLWLAAAAQPEAVDADLREALDALVRTYKTMQSGLIYETRPSNPYAAAITASVRARIADLERRLREEANVAPPRDSQILGMLIFFQRTELQVNNGRRLGRAFLDLLRQNHEGAPPPPQPTSGPSLLEI
jgi:hypothetical protein